MVMSFHHKHKNLSDPSSSLCFILVRFQYNRCNSDVKLYQTKTFVSENKTLFGGCYCPYLYYVPKSSYSLECRLTRRHYTVLYPRIRALPWLRRLVASFSSRSPGFAPGLILMGFVVDKVALGQVFVRVLRFSPVNISFQSI
jgi:hypothetical protein